MDDTNTIYVAQSGSKSGDGSIIAPHKTIQQAIERSIDGNIIIVAPGYYTDRFFGLHKSLLIRAAIPGSVIIISQILPPGITLEGIISAGKLGQPSSSILVDNGILCYYKHNIKGEYDSKVVHINQNDVRDIDLE